MRALKLGKRPARPDAPAFRLARFTAPRELPPVPPTFGHAALIGDYGMLANDRYGDCVWAGAAHETMLWAKIAGREVNFTDQCVLGDYGACTGFNPSNPASDQGSDMQDAADYRRKTGILDASGQRHVIAAHLGLEPGNIDHLYHAAYLFNAVGIGLNLPSTALNQFNAGKPWSVVANAKTKGGHYVSFVGRSNEGLLVVTWGKLQVMTEEFLQRYCDECRVYVSQEALINRKSAEGFDYDLLVDYLRALNA